MIIKLIDRMIRKLKKMKKQLRGCVESKPQHSHEHTKPHNN
jgi:hypothetical protein